jgi:hypothetical protein
MRVDDERVRLVAAAVNVSEAAYGRHTVGARITEISEADMLAVRRLIARHG